MNIHDLSAKSFREGLLRKNFSALEIIQAFLDSVQNSDKNIGAYLALFKDDAVREAKKTDMALAHGEDLPILAGLPMAIKDNILIKGTKTTAASLILENYVAAYDAVVIEKLRAAGAVFLGKTNLDEFAMGSSTENSAFQFTRNPYNKDLVPGGSSGGSAAAVAADMAVAALGSDTGGSIRQPAAFCGVVGLRPTYGAVSRHGLIAMASSLDQIGPITKTVEDAEILFKEIAGKDGFDSTSAGYNSQSATRNLEDIRKLKIGVPKEYFSGVLDKEIEKGVNSVISLLKSSKFEFKEISLPHTKYALSVYYIIVPAEVSSNLARFDGIKYSRISNVKSHSSTGGLNLKDIYFIQRGESFGEEVQRRILLGTFVLSAGYYDAYYDKAQRVRRLIKEDFDKAFDPAVYGVDVILTPMTPTAAFRIGEKTSDPLSMYMSDIFAIPASLASLPSISIPVHPAGTLPVGFQLIGKPFCEADILALGGYYERMSK